MPNVVPDLIELVRVEDGGLFGSVGLQCWDEWQAETVRVAEVSALPSTVSATQIGHSRYCVSWLAIGSRIGGHTRVKRRSLRCADSGFLALSIWQRHCHIGSLGSFAGLRIRDGESADSIDIGGQSCGPRIDGCVSDGVHYL